MSSGTFVGGQRQLDEWAEPDPWPFDHYGPTRRQPLPEAEAKRTVLREKLSQHGFDLDCIREADGIYPGQDHHPDDIPETYEVETAFSGVSDYHEQLYQTTAEDLAGLRE